MFNKYGLNIILPGITMTLIILLFMKNSTSYVVAKGDGGVGAKHVFALAGNQLSNRESFYLVDTKQEVIMVYEYGIQGEGLGLVSVLSYKFDRLLEQYGISNFGPSIDMIKKEIKKAVK